MRAVAKRFEQIADKIDIDERNGRAARICVSYLLGTYCGMVEEWLTA